MFASSWRATQRLVGPSGGAGFLCPGEVAGHPQEDVIPAAEVSCDHQFRGKETKRRLPTSHSLKKKKKKKVIKCRQGDGCTIYPDLIITHFKHILKSHNVPYK
jgi:hypothetical protein